MKIPFPRNVNVALPALPVRSTSPEKIAEPSGVTDAFT